MRIKQRLDIKSALRSIFYKPVELRPMDEILKSLKNLEHEEEKGHINQKLKAPDYWNF